MQMKKGLRVVRIMSISSVNVFVCERERLLNRVCRLGKHSYQHSGSKN